MKSRNEKIHMLRSIAIFVVVMIHTNYSSGVTMEV